MLTEHTVIFAACFMVRGHDTHIDFVSGRHD